MEGYRHEPWWERRRQDARAAATGRGGKGRRDPGGEGALGCRLSELPTPAVVWRDQRRASGP